jgi:hypothetical protein
MRPKRYEGRVKDGGILVSVHCDTSEEISRAKDVLKQAGGEDIASSGEKAVSTHTAGTDKNYTDANRAGTTTDRTYTRDVTTGTTVADDELIADRSTRR